MTGIYRVSTAAVLMAFVGFALSASLLQCPEVISLEEGSQVIIDCGQKQRAEVNWYKGIDAEENLIVAIKLNTSRIHKYALYEHTENSSLIIKSLIREVEDFYTIVCIKSDGRKEKSNASVKIKEQETPSVRTQQDTKEEQSVSASSIQCPEVIALEEESQVIINCGQGERPEINWYKGTESDENLIVAIKGKVLLIRNYTLYDHNENFSLIIKHLSHETEDVYTVVWIDLDGRKENATASVKIKEPETPSVKTRLVYMDTRQDQLETEPEPPNPRTRLLHMDEKEIQSESDRYYRDLEPVIFVLLLLAVRTVLYLPMIRQLIDTKPGPSHDTKEDQLESEPEPPNDTREDQSPLPNRGVIRVM